MEKHEDRTSLINTIKELMTINKIPRILFNEIEVFKKVGEGGQAKVYKGIYKGEEVALKILQDIDHKCLAHEIVILSNLKHECIPKFYGIVLETDKIGFVSRLINGKPADECDIFNMEEKKKLKIMKQLASILQYIHENTFIHRDLKPENMMIDKNGDFYLIDFGIAKVMTNMIDTLTRAKGTIYYLAPETLEAAELNESEEIVSKITTKVDVWAFGCIMSYFFSGTLPWCNKYNNNNSAIQKILLKKYDFPTPEKEIKEKNYKNESVILQIINSCCIIDSEKRSSIKKINEDYFSKLDL